MSELTRYGLQWDGPNGFIYTEMADGYWTPWHIAQAQLAAEREKVRMLREAATDSFNNSTNIGFVEYVLKRAIQATAPEQEGE